MPLCVCQTPVVTDFTSSPLENGCKTSPLQGIRDGITTGLAGAAVCSAMGMVSASVTVLVRVSVGLMTGYVALVSAVVWRGAVVTGRSVSRGTPVSGTAAAIRLFMSVIESISSVMSRAVCV